MQKWEYLTILFSVGESKIRRPYARNGKELPNWKTGPTVAEYLNQLGEEGWEFVAVDGGLYIFKRPKQGQS